LFDINPWGLTSVATAIVACLFAFFLWRKAVPTPVTRRFTVLLLVEVITVLTASGGLLLLFNIDSSAKTNLVLVNDALHHVGDVLMLVLYPMFVAHALPLKVLKPLITVPGRITLWVFGMGLLMWVVLDHAGIVATGVNPDMALYMMMVIMFVMIFILSVIGVNKATTQLAREKALAFVVAFGIRDLAWAAVYFVAAIVVAGGLDDTPEINILLSQLYAGGTLLYIPIVTYGILKVQLLDIEVRLQSTVRNTVLASTFIAVYYLISEGVNNLISNQLGEIIGFLVCAVLAIFLAPLNRWADRFAEKLVNADTDSPDYVANRGLQIYSAAVEEALAYGEINAGQIALLDRLKQSLQISDDDATRVETHLQFDRAAVVS